MTCSLLVSYLYIVIHMLIYFLCFRSINNVFRFGERDQKSVLAIYGHVWCGNVYPTDPTARVGCKIAKWRKNVMIRFTYLDIMILSHMRCLWTCVVIKNENKEYVSVISWLSEHFTWKGSLKIDREHYVQDNEIHTDVAKRFTHGLFICEGEVHCFHVHIVYYGNVIDATMFNYVNIVALRVIIAS